MGLSSKGIFFLALCVVFATFFYSCKSTKSSRIKVENLKRNDRDKKTEALLREAKKYKNTKYKAGGTDEHGMDCSGLVFTSYKKIEINLPRVSKDQSALGTEINLKESKSGDLIFFATSGKSKGINHVGIITSVEKDSAVYFIHSTLKSGVTENNISEPYYRDTFVKVKRIY